jgi:hypothetical protein
MSNLGLINPVIPGEITQAGMLVCVSSQYDTYYPSLTKPDTSALAAGFRQAGVLSELPNIEVGRETEPVVTGIYGLPQELLFKGVSGKVSFNMFSVDPGILALGLGVDPVVTAATGGTTASTITVDDNVKTKLTLAVATGFAVGDTVQVCDSAAKGFSTNFAKIQAIEDTEVTLDRKLREDQTTGAAVTKVTQVMIPLGGTTPKYFSFAGLVDFPDGHVMLVSFPKVYSAKAMSFGLGSGNEAVKVPIELQALGSLDATYGVLMGKIIIWP